MLPLICATALLSISTSCNKAASAAPASIRVGFFPNITHAQALYGKQTGRFQEKLGDQIAVEWKQFNAGPSEIEAMFAGEVDIGYIGPIPAINGNLTSKGDLKVIAGATNAGAVFVTRPGLSLSSAAELSGLTIAIPQFGNTQHVSLLHILQEAGLQTTDKGGTVEMVSSENADTLTLLDKGEIDGALVPEPWGSRMQSEVGANLFLDEKQVWKNGEYPVAVVLVNVDFMQKNPELVKAFLQAHVGITQEINADPAASRELVNQELLALTQKALAPDILEQAFGRVIVTYDIDTGTMNEFLDLLVGAGLAEKPGGTPQIVDTSLLGR